MAKFSAFSAAKKNLAILEKIFTLYDIRTYVFSAKKSCFVSAENVQKFTLYIEGAKRDASRESRNTGSPVAKPK